MSLKISPETFLEYDSIAERAEAFGEFVELSGDQLFELLAEVRALRTDSERLAWLRNPLHRIVPQHGWGDFCWSAQTCSSADAMWKEITSGLDFNGVIDAAMDREGERNG